MSLGHTLGLSLEDVISQDGTFFGMYPTTVVRDFDGNLHHPSLISIFRDQQGLSIHFLDMEIVQLTPGTCNVKMYDKRLRCLP